MDRKNENRDPVFHERVDELVEHGYNGFTVTQSHSKAGGIEVTARHPSGKIVSASGETKEEAFKKIIDQVDMLMDEPE